jgi:predicted nucleotidyltransferase
MASTDPSTPRSPADSEAPLSLDDVRNRLRAELLHLRRRWAVERIGIFGSYVHGEASAGSDVDVLVTFLEKPDLFEYAALEPHLEAVLGVSVDVGMPTELRPSFRDRVMKKVEYL